MNEQKDSFANKSNLIFNIIKKENIHLKSNINSHIIDLFQYFIKEQNVKNIILFSIENNNINYLYIANKDETITQKTIINSNFLNAYYNNKIYSQIDKNYNLLYYMKRINTNNKTGLLLIYDINTELLKIVLFRKNLMLIIIHLLIILVGFFFILYSFYRVNKIKAIFANRFYEIFHFSYTPILILNKNFDILYYNKSAKKFFNLKNNRNLKEFLNDKTNTIDTIINYIKLKKHLPIEFEFNINNQKIPCEIFISQLFEDNEPIIHIIVNDLSEKKKWEQEKKEFVNQLIELEKYEIISHIISNMIHNFNNMLTIILGNTELWELNTKKENLSYAKKIKDAISQIKTLLKQFLLYSKQGQYKFEIIDMHNLLNSMVDILKDKLKNIQIKYSFNANHYLIMGDANLINNALMNLAINAKEAMLNGGIFEIYTSNKLIKSRINPNFEYEYFVLTLKDSGIGMNKQTKENMFNPYFTTKNTIKNIGMGLTSTLEIIKKHNGFIKVISEPNKGTEIKIYIPVYNEDTFNTFLNRKYNNIILISKNKQLISMRDFPQINIIPQENINNTLNFLIKHINEINTIICDYDSISININELIRSLFYINIHFNIIIISEYSIKDIDNEYKNMENCIIIEHFNKRKLLNTIKQLHKIND